jgi:uncharacterized protein
MKIGKIISIEYDQFKVKLFHTTKTSTISINGDVYYFGNIGSYLKTENSTGDFIICEVTAILDHDIESKTFSSFNLDSSRELVIKPIGTLIKGNKFKMGVGIFPSIYSDVRIVTKSDIHCILSQYQEISKVDTDDGNVIHRDIDFGLSKNMIDYQVKINIDRLFNIHTAVLGNSGSGKSNTIAHILQQIYRKTDNFAKGAKTILFDVNGEYKSALSDSLAPSIQCKCYKPNSNGSEGYLNLFLPYYLLTLEEWLAFLLASERTQKPFWDKVLQESFKFFKIFNADEVANHNYENYFKWKIRNILRNVVAQADNDTVKMTIAQGVIVKCREIVSGLPNSESLIGFLNDINKKCGLEYGRNDGELSNYLIDLNIDEAAALSADNERLTPGEYFDHRFLKTATDIVILEEEARGNSRVREYTSTMITRLDYFLTHEDCKFMRNSPERYKNEVEYIKKLFGIDDEEKNTQLSIINSGELGADILELITSVLSRMIFENRKRKEGQNRRKNPVHMVLDEAHRYIKKDTEYILKENIFERIAREGRKFSLYLIVSSQRPSELSSTVLSQCGNYIIHRIQNELDMRYIYSVLPYFSEDYTTKIKQAIPGEALVFGNCVPMPLQVMVQRAKPDPDSENCLISEEWFLQSNV